MSCLNNKHSFFSHVWKLETQGQGASMLGSGGGPVPGVLTASCRLVAFFRGEEGEVQLFFFPSENTDSIMGAPFASLDCLPEASPHNTIPLGVRASTHEFWRGTSTQSLTPLNTSLQLWSNQECPHCFCQPMCATQSLHVCVCVCACMHACMCTCTSSRYCLFIRGNPDEWLAFLL